MRIPAAAAAPDESDRIRHMPAKEAATAVEGIFVSMLVGEMKKTLSNGGFFGEGPGAAVFDGMFERMMGEEIARKGGLGLAAVVEAQLKPPARAHQAARPATDLEGAPRP
jgi:peptidoglycan hydrolase FlgJ